MSVTQVIGAQKPKRRSRKPPALKSQVVIRRALNQSKTEIAQELGITRNTVRTILEESNIDRMLEDGRIQGAKLIPESLRVIQHRLEKNSETAATFVLSKTIWNPDNQGHGSGKMAGDIHLQQALAIYVHGAKTETKELTVPSNETLTTGTSVNHAQPDENKGEGT